MAASLLQRMTVDAEDVERVIAACSTVPLAELDAHLEVFLSKRPFYVPSIGEGAEEAEEVEVDIKALRRLIEAKAEANGAQEGEWTRQDVDELDDAALLSKVLLVNARVRRAKAMVGRLQMFLSLCLPFSSFFSPLFPPRSSKRAACRRWPPRRRRRPRTGSEARRRSRRWPSWPNR